MFQSNAEHHQSAFNPTNKHQQNNHPPFSFSFSTLIFILHFHFHPPLSSSLSSSLSYLALVSRISYLVSRFSFLVSRFSFLVSRFSFLISRFSFLISRFSFLFSQKFKFFHLRSKSRRLKIDFIQSQIRSSDRWIDYVLSDLKPEEWELVTAVNSSINCQIGHLILSKYFHGVMSIFPAEHEIHVPFKAHFPLQELQKHYFIKSNPGADWPD
ncbi:MAG: hypothetical protein ACFB10_18515, partial [Salibacteraceae bacterium]